jgi:putative FmdB family regulatory protein
MAKYDYECKLCQIGTEVERSIHEEEQAIHCPECKDLMKRVYGPVGVVMKGAGFYKTDTAPSNNFYSENGSTL